jgi:hypothetical protein
MKHWQGVRIRIPFLWVEGIALFPFVFLRPKSPSKALRNHEAIHLRQQVELGVFLFYIWYLCEYLYRRCFVSGHYAAYRAISFEREAFENERDKTYLSRRTFWAFRNYL